MAKKNITAIWESCKSLIEQAKKYADEGYERAHSSSGLESAIKPADPNAKIEAMPLSDKNFISVNSIPKNILDGISASFGDVIEFVEQYLLNAKSSACFYGLILIGMTIGIDFSQRGLIDVNVKESPIEVTFNPFYAREDDGTFYTLNKIIGVTTQEMLRILYLHPSTFASLNPMNDPKKHDNLIAASDVSSSETVLSEIAYDSDDRYSSNSKAVLPNNSYVRADLEAELSTDRGVKSKSSVDYYYSVAEAYRKKEQPSMSGSDGKNQIAMPGSDGGRDTHQWEKSGDADDIEDKIKCAVKDAYDSMPDDRKGDLPGGIAEQIKKLFQKPELNWRDILRKYVGIYPSGHRPTRQRLNRRQPERFDLSGQLTDKIVKLVICIDTSGSMSDKTIAYCMNEIEGIVRGYKTDITIIECDAEVNRVYKVKKASDVKPNVCGRGGTSYVPAIEYINSHNELRGSVMIYFTDGFGDCEIPRPNTYRNLWVITDIDGYGCGAGSLSVRNPYGEVKTLKGDAKLKKMRGDY